MDLRPYAPNETDLAVLMQPQQFPRAAVVIAGPTAIEHVAEAKEPV